MRYVCILLLHVLSPAFVDRVAAVVHLLRIDPHGPVGGIFLEQVPREDTVAAGVLDVYVQILALHGDDGVEVDLESLRDAFFDAELLRLGARVPPPKLAEGEEKAEERKDERGVPAGGSTARVGGFGFGWWRDRLAQEVRREE